MFLFTSKNQLSSWYIFVFFAALREREQLTEQLCLVIRRERFVTDR